MIDGWQGRQPKNLASMPKRFHDSGLWNEDWYIDLSLNGKLFYQYMIDTCDHAGIWKPNIKHFEFILGSSCPLVDLLNEINMEKERVVKLPNGRHFIPNFIPFQYGSVLNLNNRVHLSICNSLILNKIPLGSIRPQIEVKEGVKDKDKDKDYLRGGSGGRKYTSSNVARILSENYSDPKYIPKP